MKLSILICTLPSRKPLLDQLLENLRSQMKNVAQGVEVITNDREKPYTTGSKRNWLLAQAKGKYVVFIDDDDEIMNYYLEEMLRGIESGADCLAINGWMTTDGNQDIKWFISKNYENVDAVRSGEKVYHRKTNHITAVKREIALQAGFPDKSNAEDKYYSDRVAPLCKSEFIIEKPMYHYRYSTQNKEYR